MYGVVAAYFVVFKIYEYGKNYTIEKSIDTE